MTTPTKLELNQAQTPRFYAAYKECLDDTGAITRLEPLYNLCRRLEFETRQAAMDKCCPHHVHRNPACPICARISKDMMDAALACGDCDPCLGGRPDQCAISPTALCPLCKEPLDNSKDTNDVIENVHIGRVHLSCILLHAITNKP